MASAQVLGDLIRCTRYVVQTLVISHGQDLEHLREDVTLSSVISKHLMLNMQKETAVLIESLDILFHRSKVIVSELTLYIIDIQRVQEQLIVDCGLEPLL